MPFRNALASKPAGQDLVDFGYSGQERLRAFLTGCDPFAREKVFQVFFQGGYMGSDAHGISISTGKGPSMRCVQICLAAPAIEQSKTCRSSTGWGREG